jgi:hypothetical protein
VDKPPVNPLEIDEGVADGLRRMGVSEADIEAQMRIHRAPEPQDFEVYGDCWESVLFFLTVKTQWVYEMSSMGSRRAGLNYQCVESAARMAGIRRALWPGLFADLLEMEGAVLRADNGMAG